MPKSLSNDPQIGIWGFIKSLDGHIYPQEEKLKTENLQLGRVSDPSKSLLPISISDGKSVIYIGEKSAFIDSRGKRLARPDGFISLLLQYFFSDTAEHVATELTPAGYPKESFVLKKNSRGEIFAFSKVKP